MSPIALVSLVIAANGGSAPPNGLADLEAACKVIETDRFGDDYRAYLRTIDEQDLGIRRGYGITADIRRNRAKLILPFVRKHQVAIRHVEKAVRSPIRYPKNQRDEFSFPYLSRIKELTAFLALDAEAQIALNQPDQAASRLLTGMKVARSLQGMSIIAEMLAFSTWATLLTTVNLTKDDLSPKGWATLADFAESCLKPPPPVTAVIQHQLDDLPRSLTSFGNSRSTLEFLTTFDPGEDREGPLPQVVKNLSEKRANEIVQLGAGQARRNFRKQLEWLKMPEATWWPSFTRYPEKEADPLKAETEDDLVTVVRNLLGMDNAPLLRNTMLLRTQLRLVVLHSKLRAYRSKKGRYPKLLETVVARDEAFDPFSNKPFHYRLLANGSFDLYSNGVAGTGRIHLRYQPPFSVART